MKPSIDAREQWLITQTIFDCIRNIKRSSNPLAGVSAINFGKVIESLPVKYRYAKQISVAFGMLGVNTRTEILEITAVSAFKSTLWRLASLCCPHLWETDVMEILRGAEGKAIIKAHAPHYLEEFSPERTITDLMRRVLIRRARQMFKEIPLFRQEIAALINVHGINNFSLIADVGIELPTTSFMKKGALCTTVVNRLNRESDLFTNWAKWHLTGGISYPESEDTAIHLIEKGIHGTYYATAQTRAALAASLPQYRCTSPNSATTLATNLNELCRIPRYHLSPQLESSLLRTFTMANRQTVTALEKHLRPRLRKNIVWRLRHLNSVVAFVGCNACSTRTYHAFLPAELLVLITSFVSG